MGKKSSTAKSDITKGGTKKKIWGTKQVLASPFAPQMPSPIPGTSDAVQSALKKVFPLPPLRREPRPNKNKQNAASKEMTGIRKPPGFVLGVNEVTKGLERDELHLVVLARDVAPSVLVTHVPILCFLKCVKLIVMPGEGVEIGQLFGVRRVLAFGIPKKVARQRTEYPLATSVLSDTTGYAVRLDYPWLIAARGEGPTPKLPQPLMKPHVSIKQVEQEAQASGSQTNQNPNS